MVDDLMDLPPGLFPQRGQDVDRFVRTSGQGERPTRRQRVPKDPELQEYRDQPSVPVKGTPSGNGVSLTGQYVEDSSCRRPSTIASESKGSELPTNDFTESMYGSDMYQPASKGSTNELNTSWSAIYGNAVDRSFTRPEIQTPVYTVDAPSLSRTASRTSSSVSVTPSLGGTGAQTPSSMQSENKMLAQTPSEWRALFNKSEPDAPRMAPRVTNVWKQSTDRPPLFTEPPAPKSREIRSSGAPPSAKSSHMNAGPMAKSAKSDAEFPCTYKDCDRGFAVKSALITHKSKEHEGYCKRCDFDTPDDDALLAHRIQSARHICCNVCGKEFRGSGARDEHQFKEHGPRTQIKCVGCKARFDLGGAFINHIWNNACTHTSRADLLQRRLHAAIAMENLALSGSNDAWDATDGYTLSSETGEEAAPASILDTTNDLDVDQHPAQQLTRASNGGVMDQYPSLADSMKTLSTGPSKQAKRTAPAKLNSKPNQKGQPASLRDRIIMSDSNIVESDRNLEIEPSSDWDALEFRRDPLTGTFMCPFDLCRWVQAPLRPPLFVLGADLANCRERSERRQTIINHLASGHHAGTDNACTKCHRRFEDKSAVTDAGKSYLIRTPQISRQSIGVENESSPLANLLAHMETSAKCGFNMTNRYGYFVHILSGGFLSVARDEFQRPWIRESEHPDPENIDLVDEDDYQHPYWTQ